ncbi:hypothetical protein [Ancylobacter oerskovii]|uniref:Uncharacterized protein n=1 Tax=Ancylobacter oerskovii TaxID=459519 RepID=A0ABW4YYH2_9HYPH|nr:hypothetical protein [Ancylobacter oerskovii]MBS7541634.1 hypothetical protein [Ancylobacter oerskovii]
MAGNETPKSLSDDDLANIHGGTGRDMSVQDMSISEVVAGVMADRYAALNDMVDAEYTRASQLNDLGLSYSEGINLLNKAEADSQGADVSLDTKVTFNDEETTLGEVAKELGFATDALQDGQLNAAEMQAGLEQAEETRNNISDLSAMELSTLQDFINKQMQPIESQSHQAAAQSAVDKNRVEGPDRSR